MSNTTTFESLDPKSSFLICRYIYTYTCRSHSYMKAKVTGTKKKSTGKLVG